MDDCGLDHSRLSGFARVCQCQLVIRPIACAQLVIFFYIVRYVLPWEPIVSYGYPFRTACVNPLGALILVYFTVQRHISQGQMY